MSLAQDQNHRARGRIKKGGDGLLITESRLHTAAHLSISKFGRRERAPPVRLLILELLSPTLGVHHCIYPLGLSFLPTYMYSVSQWLDACFCLYCSSSGNKIYSVVWSCLLICSYQITRTVGNSSSRKTSLCSINFISLCFHICRGSAVFPRGKNWLRIYLVFRAESSDDHP